MWSLETPVHRTGCIPCGQTLVPGSHTTHPRTWELEPGLRSFPYRCGVLSWPHNVPLWFVNTSSFGHDPSPALYSKLMDVWEHKIVALGHSLAPGRFWSGRAVGLESSPFFIVLKPPLGCGISRFLLDGPLFVLPSAPILSTYFAFPITRSVLLYANLSSLSRRQKKRERWRDRERGRER